MAVLQDSYSTNSGASLAVGVGGFDPWVAMIFTAGGAGSSGTSYTITAVQLLIESVGSPGNVTVSIRAVSGTNPTGSNLCSATVNCNAYTGSFQWVEWDFGSGTFLTKGTKYAIVMNVTSSYPTNYVHWGASTSGSYTGNESDSSDGSSWSTDYGGYLDFKTYSATWNLQGSVNAISTLTGTLTAGIARYFIGTVSGISTLTGTLTAGIARYFIGTVNAVSSLIGSLGLAITTPSISSVYPVQPTASNIPQPLTIKGTNFASGCNVTLRSQGTTYSNVAITSFSSSTMVIYWTFAAVVVWTVEVINPNGKSSGQFGFSATGRLIACIGDPSDHGGILITSNQDGTLIATGAVVGVNGAQHSCPITDHGTTSVTAVTTKSYQNGKLILTKDAVAGCGAKLIPPDRKITVE